MSFNRWTLSILAVCVFFTSIAHAELKLGYVDLQRALSEVDEGKAAKGKLQKVLEGKQRDLDKEQQALRKEKDLLDKQASAMSEETRIAKQTELQKKLFDLGQKWEKGKTEMAAQERSELQVIFNKMDPIISSIAQREGFTMIFEKTDSGLVYAPSHLDVTNELVRLFNDQSRSGKSITKTDPSKSVGKKDVSK